MLDRRHSVLRNATGKLAIAVAASLAAIFALAPVAVAAPGDESPTPPTEAPESPTPPTDVPESPTPPTDVPESPAPPTDVPAPGEATTPSQPSAPAPSEATASLATQDVAAVEVEPDFGNQKFRVGVKIATGSYVPAGTTTEGSTFTINFGDGDSATCTTTGPVDADGVTWCNYSQSRRSSAVSSSVAPAAVVAQGGVTVSDSDSGDVNGQQLYFADGGSTVTISQDSAAPNLQKYAGPGTVTPCDADPDSGDGNGWCAGNYYEDTKLSSVVFTNIGLPPVAANDVRTTEQGTSIDINVLDNDNTVNGAPLTEISLTSEPAGGTATIVNPPAPVEGPVEGALSIQRASVAAAAAASTVIRYTPKAGFTGVDTFNYIISTPNGTAAATVTVTIKAGTVVAVAPSADDDEGVLPEVGGANAQLLLLAAGLLASGGGLTVLGRRRDEFVS